MPESAPPQLIRSLEEAALNNGLDPLAFGRQLSVLASAAPDPDRALRNLQRYLETGFSASRIRDFIAFPVLLEVLFELVGHSQYLADILVRDPELLRWLTASNELKRKRTSTDLLAEAVDMMALFERADRKLDAVRRLHRREMLRIGAREILQEADVETITAELSSLADAVAQAVCLVAHTSLNVRLNADRPHALSVIALGKLGGEELNFSSDIDLMFVYDVDGELPQPAGRLRTLHEYHVRLAEEIVEGLSEFTAEGHFYRVDMRLRPDGRSGPLAMSRAAMMDYYESRGTSWERQMLLKARVIAGSAEVGERFLRDLRPFLFPRSSLKSPWEEIAGMKRAIELEGADDANIKLGAGGIRDVEFLVQGLQLLYAGNDASLRTGNTLRAIERLSEANQLPRSVSMELRRAYEFLRTVEHRLQLLHGHQTHQLPRSKEEVRVLARKLGFRGAESFRGHLTRQRDLVRTQFQAFTSPSPEHAASASDEPIEALIAEAVAEQDWSEPVQEVVRLRMRGTFAAPQFRRALEVALRQKSHRSWLLKTALAGPRVMELFASEPLLVESLLGNAQELLGRPSPGWNSMRASDLRRYVLYNSARSAVRFIAEASSVRSIESELSALAEDIVSVVANRIDADPKGLAIVGMGKLGGREMGFGSDLDVVCVFSERSCERARAEEFSRQLAATMAQVPPLYKVDFRLRPEGKNAPLAVEADYLASYLENRAEPWEQMALSRARIVWGDRRFGAGLLRKVRTKICGPLSRPAAYLLGMRGSMERQRVRDDAVDVKVSSGGIADAEFVAQALALADRDLMGLSTDETLRRSISRRMLKREVGTTLRTGLETLRAVEMVIRLSASGAGSIMPSDQASVSCIAAALGFEDGKAFKRALASTMRANRSAFRSALRSLGGRQTQ